MATRRSRLQIKPNIGGKLSSKPGPNQERNKSNNRSTELSAGQKPNLDKQEKSLRISAEQALGAVKAFPVQIDKNDGHHSKEKGEKESVKNPVSRQPFTRLKRFGLSLETHKSKSNDQDKNVNHESQYEKQQKVSDDTHEKAKEDVNSPPVKAGKMFTRRFSSNVPKASLKVTSPLTSPSSTKHIGSDPLQSVKSPVMSPSQSGLKKLSPKSMVSGPGKRALQSEPRDSGPSVVKSPRKQSGPGVISPTNANRQSIVRSSNPDTVVKSPIEKTYIAVPIEESTKKHATQSGLKGKLQPSKDSNLIRVVQSPLGKEPNTTEIPSSGSDGTDGKSGQTAPNSKNDSMPSVVQRLPFRSRFPKARPNIEALKLKSKGLTVPREENLSRPSSPLKSPKLVKGVSPVKMFQPNVRQAGTTDEDRGQKSGLDHSIEIHSSTATEGRKRHLSTSSVSTVYSEAPPSLKNPSDKNSMTIGDLIYYNPVKNPMSNISTQKKRAKLEKEKENIERTENSPPKEPENSSNKDPENEHSENEDEDEMPVPQVKIGPDGSIIINEESLIIRKPEEAPITEIIEETENTATYASFRKPLSRIAWSQWETEKFYRALSYLGTDFSLMIKLFPNRTRYDIKTKFKREDKFNRSKIENALKNKKPFDMSFFEREAELDKVELKRRKKESEEKIMRAKLQRLEKKKDRAPKPKVESEPVERRKGTRSRKSKKTVNDDDLDEDEELPDSVPVTPVKTPVSFSPFKRNDSGPFVPPYCISQEDDTDKDSLEEQVSMSDSEILSPQRSQVTPRTDEPITINPADFPPNTNIQITQDSNNSPLVLVYHTTEDGKGDTVIHVYQLQNQPNALGNVQNALDGTADDQNSSANSEQASISEQSDQPMGESVTSEQGSLPFLIAEHTSDNVTPNNSDAFINVIDINASKITTPKKGSEGKGQSSSESDQPLYQVVAVNPEDEPQTVAIENEFRPSDFEKKFVDINVLSKTVDGKKSWKKS